MTDYTVDSFIADCRRRTRDNPDPADCVLAITPLMRRLLLGVQIVIHHGEPREVFHGSSDRTSRRLYGG